MHQSNTRTVSYFPFSYLQGNSALHPLFFFWWALHPLLQKVSWDFIRQSYYLCSKNSYSYQGTTILIDLVFFFALTYWPSLLTLWLQVFLKWRFGYLLCGCGLIGVVTALWRDIQPCGDSFVMLLHIGFCPFSCLSWMTIVKGPLCSAFFAIHFLGTTCASG